MADEERKLRHQILRQQHVGVSATVLADRWRATVEDLEDMPFGGRGFWRPVGSGEYGVTRGQLFRGIGPNAGPVRDIAVDPAGGLAPTICLATNGGVWKSDDGGATWRSISDVLPTSTIGAVGIDPGLDIIYAGTRHLVDATGIVPRAMGVFRTNDGGESWAPIDGGPDATVMREGVNRITCPAPNIVLLGCPNGLFLSVDSGANFGANAPAFNDLKPVIDGNVTAIDVDTNFRVAKKVDSTIASGSGTVSVRCVDHGFLQDEFVSVGGTEDTGALGTFQVTPQSAVFFELLQSESSGTNSTRGTVIGPNHPRVLAIDAAGAPSTGGPIVLTIPGHGLITGDVVVVRQVGLVSANGSWRVKVLSDSSVELVGSKDTASVGSGGQLLAGTRPDPDTIHSARNVTAGVEVELPGHRFVNGDRVSLVGVPGLDASNAGAVSLVSGSTRLFVVSGLKMSVPNVGPGATVRGPANAWSMAYVAVGGRAADGKRAPTRGLYRLTLSGDGSARALAISSNLLTSASVPADYDRVRFAQATLHPRILYVALQDTKPTTRFLTLLRSTDFGETWKTALVETPRGITVDGSASSDEAFTLGVDPQDDSRVYLGLGQLWRSMDAGAMFPQIDVETQGGDQLAALDKVGHATSTAKLPRNHYAMAFAPATHWPQPGIAPPITPMYFGTSGGVARSDTGGGAFVPLNTGLLTGELRSVDFGRRGPLSTYVAGEEIGIAGEPEPTGAALQQSIVGDGAQVAVDPFDSRVVYAFVDGRFVKTVNGALDWQGSVSPGTPIITKLEHQDAVSIETLGHSFANGESVTVSEVRVNGAPFDKVNGTRKVLLGNDEHFALDMPVLDVEAFPPFDPVAAAVGKRFLRELAIANVVGGSPVRVETAVEHDVASPIEVHVSGVIDVTDTNNDAAHLTWTATPVSNTAFTLSTNSSVSGAHAQTSARIRFLDLDDRVAIQFATHHDQDPIVVTALHHGFLTGSTVTIAGVRGNTNANVASQKITVIDHNSFRLDGVAGNGAWGAQPSVKGKALGRGLPASSRHERQRLALLPNAKQDGTLKGPAKVIYASVRNELYRSDDEGHSFSLIQRFNSEVTAITAVVQRTSTLDINLWVGLASGQVHSGFGREVFKGPGRDDYKTDVGARGPITGIAINPDSIGLKHVVVVAAGYTDLHTRQGTHHVFVTKTAGHGTAVGSGFSAAWSEIGAPLLLSAGTTPDIPVLGVGLLNLLQTLETVAVTDGGVIRVADRRNNWRRAGPNLPSVSCQAISVEGDRLRIATAGRGVWELVLPEADMALPRGSLGFGDRPINKPAKLTISIVNVGRKLINVGTATCDDPHFVPQNPSIPVSIAEGDSTTLDVIFTPTAEDLFSGTVKIDTFTNTGPSVFLTVKASGVGVQPGLPRVCVRSPVLRFGRVTVKETVSLPVTIRNTGTGDANVTVVRVTPATGPMKLVTIGSATPVPFRLPAGGAEEVHIEFSPKSAGKVKAKLEITSEPVPGGLPQPAQTKTIDISGEGALESSNGLGSVMATLGLAEETETVGA